MSVSSILLYFRKKNDMKFIMHTIDRITFLSCLVLWFFACYMCLWLNSSSGTSSWDVWSWEAEGWTWSSIKKGMPLFMFNKLIVWDDPYTIVPIAFSFFFLCVCFPCTGFVTLMLRCEGEWEYLIHSSQNPSDSRELQSPKQGLWWYTIFRFFLFVEKNMLTHPKVLAIRE